MKKLKKRKVQTRKGKNKPWVKIYIKMEGKKNQTGPARTPEKESPNVNGKRKTASEQWSKHT